MNKKKLILLWRSFTISSLLLVMLSVVAVSRPLGDSTLDQILLILPFFSIYYILFGLHHLGKYEEKQEAKEENEKKKQHSTLLHL
jgi:hypothetical protein